MLSHSTRTPLRFGLLAACLWLGTAPAFAQEAQPDITLKLSPAEVAEIARLIDLQPWQPCSPALGCPTPPPAFWDLQTTISRALEADPAASRAVLAARSAGQ
jgi:hypothetical protein